MKKNQLGDPLSVESKRKSYKDYLKEFTKDTSKFVNQLVVFAIESKEFYKLANIDYRSYRYELWGERITRWLNFEQAILFNYMDEEKFEEFYKEYFQDKILKNKIAKTKDKLLEWFKESESQIRYMDEQIERYENMERNDKNKKE